MESHSLILPCFVAMNQQNSEPIADTAGNIVKDRFSAFLREFHIPTNDSSTDHSSQMGLVGLAELSFIMLIVYL